MVSLKGSDTMNKTIFAGILLCIVSFILSGCNGNTYGIEGKMGITEFQEKIIGHNLLLYHKN